MAFLTFDKAELVNLEYSLARELIRSNRAGSYASMTISGCNTRKYHGLLVCPVPELDSDNHVLLSSVDLTVVQHGKEFNLGIHKYEGDNYVPRGHKYIRDFDAEKGSKMTYRVGGVVLTRETMLVQEKEQILIKITLEDAHSDTRLQFRPFLAFRNIHQLSKANLYLNRHYEHIPNGIKLKMYDGYPELHMQLSKGNEFVPVPDWYFNIEYMEEQKRGYDYKEDLYVPGYFELAIKPGESVIFSASTEEVKPSGFKRRFAAEEELRTPVDSFRNCLINSAEQFLVKRDNSVELISGFPWYGMSSRFTFISMPGLLLSRGDCKSAKIVLDTMVKKLQNGLFPVSGRKGYEFYNSADAPLWFIRVLQILSKCDVSDPWAKYRKAILEIMNAFRAGTSYGIRMLENGLITGGEDSIPVTWMDAMVDGHAVTPRTGCAVEVNALWYNAVCQLVEWLGENTKQGKEWAGIREKVKESFNEKFWIEEKNYLADYINGDYRDYAVRPNMVIATSLYYSPLSIERKKAVLDIVRSELLTSKGLRTLSPKNEAYKGVFEGDQKSRDRAAHQGSVYPWLLAHFVKGYLEVHKRSGLSLIKEIYEGFEEEMTDYGIGTIAEIFDGNPPHYPRGAISHAGSVGSLLSIGEMIDNINTIY